MIKNFHDVAFKQIQTISNNFKLWANSNFPHDLFHKSIEVPDEFTVSHVKSYLTKESAIVHMRQ